jgi:hypothetical protein
MRLLSTTDNLFIRLSYSQRNNFKKVVLLSILFTSQSVFGQRQTVEPQKIRTTETGIEIYQGVGVEGNVNQNLKTNENQLPPKSVNEYNLIECENSISDLTLKIEALKFNVSEGDRIRTYEALRSQLIQRKQFLTSQSTSK